MDLCRFFRAERRIREAATLTDSNNLAIRGGEEPAVAAINLGCGDPEVILDRSSHRLPIEGINI